MSEDAGGPATLGVEIDLSLNNAKLSIPQARAGTVSRAALIEKARGSGCRIVGVTAPAGYGKSTLLAEWADAEDRRVTWASLDRYDDDPAVLLRLLAAAYERISPETPDLVADMGGIGVSVLGRAAPRLASAFRSAPTPFVLMLDDLHELHTPACHDALGILIAGVPPGSQFVVSSRSEQPHLPRQRVSGDVLEITADDLAMDVEAARQIFAAAQLTVSPDLVTTLTARTEGWPVGLHLAAMIMRDSGEALAVSGDDRFVADYLYRESFSGLPDHIQRFLRRTAVLDQMSAPLCTAVLEDPDAPDILRTIEGASLFLVPLDRRRQWYRYHGLFREFLLAELRRVEPDIVMKLHLRAADWYESNGSPVLAVEHLLNTTEVDRCVQLVTAVALSIYFTGDISRLQRWVRTLGDAAIEAYPPFAVITAWIAAMTGQSAEAERWAAKVEGASFDLTPADGSASFESARSMLRSMMCPAGADQSLADAAVGVAQEPIWSPWRDQALALSAAAHQLVGDDDAAAALYVEALELATERKTTDVLVYSEAELALLAMDAGRWPEAATRVSHALDTVDQNRLADYSLCLIAFAAAARLELHRGDRDAAHRQLTRAMRARPTSTYALPYVAVRLRMHVASVYRSLGNLTDARHLMKEIDDVLLHRPDLGVLVDKVAQLRESLDAAAESGAAGASPLTPAELRLLPFLQTHLTIREIGERLFVSRNTVSSEVGSIYRKLGVSSRGDAVRQATEIGLLGA